jgi:ubiquinone/menaquinone biosynthesis C-methylase UbiE
MARPQSNLDYRGMALWFKIRDSLLPRARIINEVGLRPGCRVLDFGCGPGSYIPAVEERIGASGHIYALDIHPLAAEMVDRLVRTHGWKNVTFIRSDGPTGLPDGALDVVLLYDTFHALDRPQAVLAELHRVLKPSGILSFNDHHMREPDIRARVTAGGLFECAVKGRYTYTFSEARAAGSSSQRTGRS